MCKDGAIVKIIQVRLPDGSLQRMELVDTVAPIAVGKDKGSNMLGIIALGFPLCMVCLQYLFN